MNKSIIFLIIIALSFNCSESNNVKKPKLTDKQKKEIHSFSKELIRSINGLEISAINESWSNKAFKSRVSNITRTQQSVFEHIFEKDLKRIIKVENLSIIHEINSGQGNAFFLALNHFEHYSELTLLLTFDKRYDFFKYRIEIIENRPAITDFYQFKDNLWYSEKVVGALRLNSTFKAYSEERNRTNRALKNSEEALRYGDTLEALYFLYDVPEIHQVGNELSMKKLNLALSMGDSIYASVLTTEYMNNKTLYIQYLYNLYFHSPHLNEVYKLLANELGNSEALDSLIESERFWN